jgi:hypothetical protein
MGTPESTDDLSDVMYLHASSSKDYHQSQIINSSSMERRAKTKPHLETLLKEV